MYSKAGELAFKVNQLLTQLFQPHNWLWIRPFLKCFPSASQVFTTVLISRVGIASWEGKSPDCLWLVLALVVLLPPRTVKDYISGYHVLITTDTETQSPFTSGLSTHMIESAVWMLFCSFWSHMIPVVTCKEDHPDECKSAILVMGPLISLSTTIKLITSTLVRSTLGISSGHNTAIQWLK